MIANPFRFGKEVEGRQFYDREETFTSLYRKLSGGASEGCARRGHNRAR